MMDTAILFENLKHHSLKIGRTGAKTLVTLYYVMTSPSTPTKEKVLIGAALSYVVLPVSLIPKSKHPLLGLMDEGAALLFVYKRSQKLVTPAIGQQVEETLNSWFGSHPVATE